MKIKRMTLITLYMAGVLCLTSYLQAAPNNIVEYPKGYRNWVHIKSALIGPQSPAYKRYGGLHHIYANEKALEGYRIGQFQDGSVIVFDMLETQETAGTTSAGVRRFIDVMTKDSKRFPDTGGWGFEEFKGDSQTERVLNQEAKSACFDCHAKQKDKDFVFSTFHK